MKQDELQIRIILNCSKRKQRKQRIWTESSVEVYTCRRENQHARRGLVPVRTATTEDKVGHSCTTVSLEHESWVKHFTCSQQLESLTRKLVEVLAFF